MPQIEQKANPDVYQQREGTFSIVGGVGDMELWQVSAP
jgi:hypothetical protein